MAGKVAAIMSKQTKKTVLAMDTAMGGISVGIIAANGHIVSRMMETAREQAALLVPTIQEVVSEAGIDFSDIDLIGCTRGPGSFTGLRIGLATARTMALSLNIPCIGLNTLDVMARHYNTPCPQAGGLNDTGKGLLIILETKRQDFYGCYYDDEKNPLTEPFACDASEVLNRAPVTEFDIGGDCLERFQSLVAKNFNYLEQYAQPDPILMAQMTLEEFEVKGDQGATQPLYLRGADVSQPKVPPRKLEQA